MLEVLSIQCLECLKDLLVGVRLILGTLDQENEVERGVVVLSDEYFFEVRRARVPQRD